MLPRVQKNIKFNLATENIIVYTPSSYFKPAWEVTRKVAMSDLWMNHSFELIHDPDHKNDQNDSFKIWLSDQSG